MKKITEPWMQFLFEVDVLKSQMDFLKNEECFYRGHSNENYVLSPGLQRGLNASSRKIPDWLWGTESDLFYEFRSKAKSLHQQHFSDWDILFFMQHHGVKTRLLDWTDSLGVAVYFALLGYKTEQIEPPCVWILNPYRFNEEFHGERDLWDPLLLNSYEDDNTSNEGYEDLMLYENTGDIFPWDEPIALYPVRKADRLSTQNGYFTIHGNDSRPIDTIVGKRKHILKKVILPKEAIPGAIEFLEHAGINQFSLFPDLDGLSRYLNHKYFN
jgi:hypothetical protein